MNTFPIPPGARLVAALAAALLSAVASAQNEGDLRLVDGSVDSEGTVELYHDGRWGLVCDDYWDMNDAQVACRQMGYARATRATSDNEFLSNIPGQRIWLDDLACTGAESTLISCPRGDDAPRLGWHDCGRFEAAGAVCEGSLDAPVGLTLSETSMTLVESDETGGTYTMVLETAPSDDVTVDVSIPSGSFLTATPETLTFNPVNWSDPQTVTLVAGADDDTLTRTHYIAHSVTGEGADGIVVPPPIHVRVRDDTVRRLGGAVRLAGGSDPSEGRVEVYVSSGDNPGWGLVCGRSWDLVDAGVACRQLGYSGASEVGFGRTYGSVWGRTFHLNFLECTGTESSLLSCPRQNNIPIGTHDCGERLWSAETRCTGSPLTLSVADAQATEGADATLEFVVTLSEASSGTVVVDYATSDGSAEAGSDYTSAGGTLTFAAGEISKTASVPVIDDRDEDNGETLTFTLSNPSGAQLSDGTATGTINNTEAATVVALTAAFEELPESHDGENTFTFQLRFNEDVTGLSYRTLRDSAFTVTNGSVENASRAEQGKNHLWNITVKPSSGRTVTVTLPETTDCSATGAICAGTDRPLSAEVSARVAQTVRPFEVTFRNPPDEHDGATPIVFEVEFSKLPKASYSYKTMRDKTLEILQGAEALTATSATRLNPPHNDRWRVTITPTSKADLTVSVGPEASCSEIGAVCTAENEPLSNTVSKTIRGPSELAIADATAEEAEGATVDFAVSLSRASTGSVSVSYVTSDGTAQAGSDYTRTEGTLTFAAGETAKTVSVPVLDDTIDEVSESFTVTLSNASGGNVRIADATATGTITNHDHMPKAWIARFGRSVASQAVEAIGARLEGGGGSHVTVAGRRVTLAAGQGAVAKRSEHAAALLEAFAANEDSTPSLTPGEALRGSAFQLSSGGDAGGPDFTAWGRVATGGFEAEVDDMRLDGEVTSAFLGADVEGGGWLAGLALGRSTGEGDFALLEGGGGGDVESTLNAVYPYAEFGLNERVDVWGLAGFGSGDLTLTMDADAERAAPERYRTDIDMRMGAVGLRGAVIEPGQSGGLSVNIKSDAFWVRTSSDAVRSPSGNLAAADADVTRLRALVETSRTLTSAGGASLTPTVEIGLRNDGGDAETGTGLEAGAGLAYTSGVLTIEARVRTLLAHEASGYEEWGASGSVRIDPGASGRGLSLTVAPTWGTAESGTDALWSLGDGASLGTENDLDAGRRIAAEVGYGLAGPARMGTLTPYTAMTLGDGGHRTLRAGTRWQIGSGAQIGLETGRRTSGAGETRHEVVLRAVMRW